MRIASTALALCTLTVLTTACDDDLPVPEVSGLTWYTDAVTYGCDAYEEPQGEYLQSQFVHDPAASNFCEVDNMLFNCRAVNVSIPFAISDSVTDDPGPWHRTARREFMLYDDPAGGVLITSGSGTITHASITMSASTVVGNAVDVVLQSGWSTGASMNTAVVTAEIDQFDGSLSTTATHSFPIDGGYPPRAFVEANAWGEYGGFPFVPFSVTSGSFAATGTVAASFTACQEVRLFNDQQQCIFDREGMPVAADCNGWSSVAAHVHADTGNLVLLDTSNFLCLSAGTGAGAAVTHEVCSSGLDTQQQWTWDTDGRLHPMSEPSLCLAPNPDDGFELDVYPEPVTYEPLIVQSCASSDAQTWNFF